MSISQPSADPDLIQRLANPATAEEAERIAFVSTTLANVPHINDILNVIHDLALPDGWLVSGGIYQTVWNRMSGRPDFHGIKDFDVIYFDGCDLSYTAEDRVIHRVNEALPELADMLEVRNQARVHLWYQDRFGRPYRPLDCSMDALTTYAARTHAVAARRDTAGGIVLHAPFGLSNLIAMRLVPNLGHPNRETYEEKAARMEKLWPELEIIPWPEE